MSKRFTLIGLVACGACFILHVWIMLQAIFNGVEIPNSTTMMTLVCGFATTLYGLYYKAKYYNHDNRLKK